MHSRIYVLTRMDEECEIPNVEELYESVIRVNPLVDYIYYSDDFNNDIQWLAQYYGLQVEKKDEVYMVSRRELLEKLEKERENNISEAKTVLCHKEPKDISSFDLFKIMRLLQNDDGFLFYFKNALMTPYNLIEAIKDETIDDYLKVVETFDYHF